MLLGRLADTALVAAGASGEEVVAVMKGRTVSALSPARPILIAALAVFALAAGQASPAQADAIPRITQSAAAHYSSVALKGYFTAFYGAAFRARCHVSSRTHAWCQVGWYNGDLLFDGSTSIWYSRDRNGDVWWNYAFRVVRLDDYCASVEHRQNCSHTFVVK